MKAAMMIIPHLGHCQTSSEVDGRGRDVFIPKKGIVDRIIDGVIPFEDRIADGYSPRNN